MSSLWYVTHAGESLSFICAKRVAGHFGTAFNETVLCKKGNGLKLVAIQVAYKTVGS